MPWPDSVEELLREQERLAAAEPPLWRPHGEPGAVAGCFVCFVRPQIGPGAAGERAWAAAALLPGSDSPPVGAMVPGRACGAYRPGLLALREGALLEAALRALPRLPDLLLVNATGRDHPRRAGLALHLGAELGIASVGVTNRTLLAHGEPPPLTRGSTSPLQLDGECVGFWVCSRDGTRPLAAHAGWRTDPRTAAEMVLATATRARTPEPIRLARRQARTARSAAAEGSRSGTARAVPRRM